MALRTRLFLFFGGLIALLVGAEWALVTALTDDLEDEVGEVAFEVGSGVLGKLFPRIVVRTEDAPEGTAGDGLDTFRVDRSRADAPQRTFALHIGDAAPGTMVGREVDVRGEVSDARGARKHVLAARQRAGGSWRGEETDVLRIVVGSPRALDVERQGGLMVLSLDGEHLLEEAFEERNFVLAPEVGDELAAACSEIRSVVHIELAHAEPGFSFASSTARWVEGDPASVQRTGARAPATPGDGEAVAHEIPIPRGGFEAAIETFLRRLWLGTFAIFGLGLVVAGWVSHRVSVPLRSLSRAAREIGDGALGTQVPADGDPEVAGTITAFNRMSRRLAALDAEARALREREHLTEIGEMARGLAHAMRNPLHLLGLSVEQLAAPDARAERGGALAEAARSQIHRIDRSLRSFLSLSSGGGAVEDVDVDDLARDVALELLQDEASDVRVRVEASGECRVRAVAPELRAVLHVLVVNAVEASPPGGEVVVRVGCAADRVRMEVEDEGPGLSPEVRERLFTPHLTTKESGAGMGLFLAHRIATSRYGGSLALVAREPLGTRAILEIGDRGGDLRG